MATRKYSYVTYNGLLVIRKDDIGPECPRCYHVGMVLLGIILANKQLARFRTS